VFLSHGFLGKEAALRPRPPSRRKGTWRSEGGRAVRVFAPALGGAAYTCKDRVEGNSGGWQVAGSPFTGKDRYEFEKFFAPRTVLTLSEPSPRDVHGAMGTIRFPLHRHAATDSRLRRRHPRHPWTRTSSGLWKVKGPGGPPRQRGPLGCLKNSYAQIGRTKEDEGPSAFTGECRGVAGHTLNCGTRFVD